MARTKTNTTPEQSTVDVDPAAAEAGTNALTVLGARVSELGELLGDDQPYERGRVVSETQFFMSQSAEAFLQAGKRLLLIREFEPHGEFTNIIQQRLGIELRTAQRMMSAAAKYLSPSLAANATTLSLLGKSKMLDLMSESDDDLVELAEGGTVAGLKLDDMQAMSSRELRAALVEARKAAATKDRLIAKKDQTINEQAEQLERRNAVGDEATALQLEELRVDTLAAEQAIARLVATAGAILDERADSGTGLAARQAIDWVAARFTEEAATRSIAIEPLDGQGMPAFLGDVADVANGKARN